MCVSDVACVCAGYEAAYTRIRVGLRGTGADLIILEEAAFVNDKVFSTVISPVLTVEYTAILGISTAQDDLNYYSKLLNMKRPGTDELLFRVLKVGLACEACAEAGKSGSCDHRTNRLPPWKPASRHRMLQAIMGSDEAGFAREALGEIASGDHYLYKAFIRHLVKNPRVPLDKPVGAVYLAIDPSGGGAASDYTLAATILQEGRHVVSEPDVRYQMRMRYTNSERLRKSVWLGCCTVWPSARVPSNKWVKESARYNRKGSKSTAGVCWPTRLRQLAL